MSDNYAFEIPKRMSKLVRDEPLAKQWIEQLPSIVGACLDRWDLVPGVPFADCYASLVLPVTRADGSEAVLKINIPNPESDLEHAALGHWDGRGAVKLLESWTEQKALLIERCRPGDQLWRVEDEDSATRILIDVRLRTSAPAPDLHGFRLLADEAARWARDLPREYEAAGAAYDRRLLDAAVEAMLALGPDQGEQVVLHQDLHGGNVLRAERESWLIIDPKPLVGELDFDAGAYLRDRRWLLSGPEGARIIQRRLDMLADHLPIDRQRARLWGLAHCIAWGASGGTAYDEHIHAATLLMNAS